MEARMGIKEQPVTRRMEYGTLRRYKCRVCGRPFKDYALPEDKRICTRCLVEMQKVRTVRIVIPMLPPKESSPNWRGHWTKKARAVHLYRVAAKYYALIASESTHPGYEKAEVSISLVVRDSRYYRDPDNMVASLKPAIDGCVDAGIIRDDSDEHLRYREPITYVIDKVKAPETILEFTEQQVNTVRDRE
jgi:hypothetical protein